MDLNTKQGRYLARKKGIDVPLQKSGRKRAGQKKSTAAAEARRLVTKTNCERCGAGKRLEVHHKDKNVFNNDLSNLQVLCRRCHVRTHMEIDGWNGRAVKPAKCIICGVEFQPKRSRRARICSLPCLRELGKISAAKSTRWKRPQDASESR